MIMVKIMECKIYISTKIRRSFGTVVKKNRRCSFFFALKFVSLFSVYVHDVHMNSGYRLDYGSVDNRM